MNITNEAKHYIQTMLEEQKLKGIRVYIVEEGCCGPQVGLSLEVPEETDTISIINHIQVAVASKAQELLSNLTLDFETEGEQSGLVMIGAPNNC